MPVDFINRVPVKKKPKFKLTNAKLNVITAVAVMYGLALVLTLVATL